MPYADAEPLKRPSLPGPFLFCPLRNRLVLRHFYRPVYVLPGEEPVMHTVHEYELRAKECKALAIEAAPHHKLPIAHMAQMWSRLAEERRKMVLDQLMERSSAPDAAQAGGKA